MKKSVMMILLFSLLLLCGCQPKAAGEVITLRIVDGVESGNLVLAGEGAGDVFTLSVDDVTVYLDGEKADASALEDGMTAEIVHSGDIQETWPATFGKVQCMDVYSLGSEKNPGGGLYDLCGLYLQVLDDLWEKDAGLNGGAEYVSVDLDSAPGELTEGEKAAIAWIFAGKHDVEPLTLAYEELAEQGYFTEFPLTGNGCCINAEERKYYAWENGILFSITGRTSGTEQYSLSVIQFNAMKWRTPLGAYYFSDCSAAWPEMGIWSGYNVESEMIS